MKTITGEAVYDALQEIGVPAHLKGYQYISEAITLSFNDPEMINAVTKVLYPTVANKYNTTPSRVERAIRHGVEVAFDRGELDVFRKFFGNTYSANKGKPTNSEFIASVVEHLKRCVADKAAPAPEETLDDQIRRILREELASVFSGDGE